MLRGDAAHQPAPGFIGIAGDRRARGDQRSRHCTMIAPFSQFVVLTRRFHFPTKGCEAAWAAGVKSTLSARSAEAEISIAEAVMRLVGEVKLP